MKRSLTILAAAFAAVLALTAVATSSASAFTTFEVPEIGTTVLKGIQSGTVTLEIKNGNITCSGGTFRGMTTTGEHTELATSESTATLGEEAGKKGIEYSGCKFLGFIGVALKPNTCQFNFHAATGKVDIVPNSGTCASEGITFEAGGCKTHIFPVAANQGLSGVTYANSGAGTGRIVTVTPNVSNITYTAEGCASFNGTTATGKYVGGTIAVGGKSSTESGNAKALIIK